jgi:hypothetical protein
LDRRHLDVQPRKDAAEVAGVDELGGAEGHEQIGDAEIPFLPGLAPELGVAVVHAHLDLLGASHGGHGGRVAIAARSKPGHDGQQSEGG